MKTVRRSPIGLHLLAWVTLALWLALPAQAARLVDETFDVLRTKTGVYTNVTVTTKAKDYIFITHARGMTSIKVRDLPPEIQKSLGYAVSNQPSSKKNEIAVLASRALPGFTRKLRPLESNWRHELRLYQPKLKINPVLGMVILGVALLAYAGFCQCCRLICQKAKSPPSPLVWVPGLQLIPLLRASGMSPWWFVGCLVPLLNIVVGILWSFKIVKARGKTTWITLLLILPLTNILAFVYLAISSESSAAPEPPKYQSMALQTA